MFTFKFRSKFTIACTRHGVITNLSFNAKRPVTVPGPYQEVQDFLEIKFYLFLITFQVDSNRKNHQNAKNMFWIPSKYSKTFTVLSEFYD